MKISYLIATTIAAANFASPHLAWAEIWRCRSANGSTILTNVPASDSSTQCNKIDLARIAFIKLPAEQFEQLGRPGQKNSSANAATAAITSSSTSATSTSFAKPATSRLKLDRMHGLKPSTSFEANESATGRRGRRAEFERRCDVHGTARSVDPGEGRIRIRRGALTVDEVAVRLGGIGKPVKWRTSLSGACRNPEVTVESE